MAEVDIILPRAVGGDGNSGWTPVLAVVADGDRRVQQVTDWTGGTGTKPATGQYVGPAGLVTLIGDATDIAGSLVADKAAAAASAQDALAAKNDATNAASVASGAAQTVADTADDVNALYQDTLTAQGATVAAFQNTQAIAEGFGDLNGAITIVEDAAAEATAAKDESEQIRDDFLAYTIPADIVTGALPDPVSQALFALQEVWIVQPALGPLAAYERFIADLVASGSFSSSDYLLALNGHYVGADLLPLNNPAKVLTAYGVPTRTPFVGYKGGASSALAVASGVSFDQSGLNNQSMSYWMVSPPTVNGFDVRIGASGYMNANPAGPSQVYRINDGTNTTVSGLAADTLFSASRVDSATKRLFKNGALVNTASVASTTGPNALSIGAANSAGSTYSDSTIAVVRVGASMSDQQEVEFYAATKRFVEAMRAFA